jgi:hypothetical protein
MLINKKIYLLATLFVLVFSAFIFRDKVVEFAKAVTTWQEVDLNADNLINSTDIDLSLSYLHCPLFGVCGASVNTPTPTNPPGPTSTPGPTNTPVPTNPPGQYTACNDIPFGTQIMSDANAQLIIDLHEQTANRGFAFTGGVGNAVDFDPRQGSSFGFADLPGWQRGFVEGVMDRLQNKVSTATSMGLANHYEYLAYGPEYEHGAGVEAAWPDINVPIIEGWAAAGGKLLMFAPSRQDYTWHEHQGVPAPPHINEVRPDINTIHLIADVAQHVDYWGLQLGFLQGYVDDGAMTEAEFTQFISGWHDWIKVGDPAAGHPGNPNTKIVVQMGIARYDGINQQCQPADPMDYVLAWRERLAPYADGLVVMASQRCQPCPPNPPPGFICSTDPADHAIFAESFVNVLAAAHVVCP